VLERVLTVLLGASWVYWLVACWLVRCFFRHYPEVPEPASPEGGGAAPAGSHEAGPPYLPPVSILKPVRGLEAEVYENFESFCRQDYPDYEIIFGVADADDPVVPVIQRLQQVFTRRRITLIVAEPFAPNRKAAMLHHLAGQARHEILVMSDSDMRVTPDYLRRVVAPLADPRVGLVTCPYIGGSALSLPAGLEALHMGVTFLPSVVVARRAVAMRFALGASITLRRADLARLGGFQALSTYLAEDYQIGARVAGLGLRVHLSRYVVTSILGATSFSEQCLREVRWARCSRVSRPREYPGILLTMSTPLALLLALLYGPTPAYGQALAVSLVLRWAAAWLVTSYTGDRVSRRWILWLPLRDVLSALVWVAGGLGRHVVWRGETYALERGGHIRALEPGEEAGEEERVGS
jgi:ceramide glucosyltransferase